jgi:hypothetical protein
VAQFLSGQPFQIVVTEEPKSGDLVYRVKIHTQPPLQWAAVIGDAIHNLRSALDLLVWQLVLANGGTPDTATAYPISKSAATFEKTMVRVKGLSQEAQNLIRATKPYQGGNEVLWQLHQLDIVDKHHLLVPVGAAHRNIVVDVSAELRRLKPDWEIPAMPLALRPADRQYPLQDGAELFRVMAAARSSADMSPQFTFEIAFGEGDIVRGEPLVPTLQQFATSVQDVVEPFKLLLAGT